MPRLTLSDALSTLGDTAVSGFSVFPAGATTAQKKSLINQVLERFLSMPSWKGIDGLVTFNVYDNMITLPHTLESIKRAGVNDDGLQCPVPIHNLWYQFHSNGPGVYDITNPRLYTPAFQDLGYGYVTYRDPLNPFKLKIVTDVTESSNTIRFTGYDVDQKPVYTSTTLGVTLNVNTSGSTTTQVFSALANVYKPLTNGRVLLYSVDNDTAEETLIAVYEASETTIDYRRYYVTGAAEETRTFRALCKRSYVQGVNDNDLLFPDNLGALKLGLQALNYENKDDERAGDPFATPPTGWWGRAWRVLNGDLSESQADTSQTINIQMGAFAGAGIKNML